MKKTIVGSLCLLTALSASADLVVSTFTGGDAGEGIDLSGTYVYTVNLGGSVASLDIQGYTFVNAATAGISLSANHLANWATSPDYGTTTDDNALESMMFNTALDWDGTPFINIAAPVTIGQQYALQLLMSENSTTEANRRQDIIVEGLTILDDFQITQGLGVSNPQTYGTLVYYTFTATDDTLNLELARGAGGTDPNPVAQAFTLQVVPEPSTLGLAVIGLGLAALRRRLR